MKRLFHFSIRTTRRLLVLLIILTGLLVIAGRLLAPLAAQYRAEVEQWASGLLGQPVTVGQLRGSWRGLGPELILHELQLIDPNSRKPTLYLDEVRIAIGLVDSLRRLSPVVRKVTVISPRLRVTRLPNGALTIGNLNELNEFNPGDGSSAFLLPTHLSLENGEVIWEDQTVRAPPLRLTEVNLSLRNGGNRHQLNGNITLPGEHQGRIELAIDLHGQLDRLETWSARSYMRSSGIDLAFLLNRRVANSYRFSNRQAEITLWGEWDPRGLVSLEGTTQWEQVAITRQTGSTRRIDSTLNLDRVGGAIRLQRQPRGWRLDLANLQIQRNNREWPKSQAGVIAQQSQEGHWHIRAGSSHLRLEDIHAISTLFPLPDIGVEQLLEQLQANGNLNNLRLNFQQLAEGDRWAASGEISAFNSKPWEGLPGIRNLPLRFWMDAHQGTIALDAADVTLDFSDLFRDPLQLQRLQGDLKWQRQPQGDLVFSSDRLLAENADIHTLSRMHLTIPAPDRGSPFLDLQSDFWDGDASTTHRYLPTGIMGENVVAWVDRAIGDGHVTAGSALVRGPLADFPFEKTHSGRFEVFFNVENLRLDYWPEWPPLNNLGADVRFLNNSFDAWASDGEILDSRLKEVHARITKLSRTSPLELNGAVQGPLGDHLRLLTESPLRNDFARLVKDLKGQGMTHLDLAFSLPIDDDSAFTLDGRLGFLDATLELERWQTAISDIRGDLRFDQNHIFATGITGTTLGLPIRVDVSTPKNRPNATRISATAKIPVSTLQQQLPAINPAAFASGSSEWRLDLDIPHITAGPDAPVTARASSDLQGVRIDQPAPLGKAAGTARALLLETRMDAAPEQRLHIRYDNQVDAALLLDHSRPGQTRLQRGGITLGGARASLPQEPGLELNGRLEHLSLSPWLAQRNSVSQDSPPLPPLKRLALEIGRLEVGQQQTEGVRLALTRGATQWEGSIISDWAEGGILLPLAGNAPATVTARLKHLRLDPWLDLLADNAPGGGEETTPERLLLSTETLQYKQAKVEDFHLDFSRSVRGDWQGGFRSSHFEGRITVPPHPLEKPIRLSLERLDLEIDDTLFSGQERVSEQPHKSLDPHRIPAIEAEIKQVNINAKPFGSLQLITQHHDSGLALQALSLNSDRLQLSATGGWELDPETQRASSRLDLSLSSRDLGSALQDLQLSSNIEGAPVELDSRLSWPASPFDFNTRLLNGRLGMQIGKGRFLKVDPGVGRLFGLFNLGALRRRLTLDFSDIFQKGFSFDSIEGTYLLDAGDAYTNDFRMKGPSADIELSGRIGVGDEDFDALVTITPKISSSIPLAGAIAGGPAVGAALFLAQQLMGESIDRATRLEYMATGSWDDPVLTPKIRDEQEGAEPARQGGTPPPLPQAPAATEQLQEDQPAAASEADTDTGGEQTAKPSGFFSRLLKKLKPTGPSLPNTSPQEQ